VVEWIPWPTGIVGVVRGIAMSRMRKLSRQISVVALALISVTALLLATGLLVYVDDSGGLPFEMIEGDNAVPMADPNGEEISDEPGEQGANGINWENPSTVVVASMIIVAIFVFVWFLVFRPRSEGEEPAKEAEAEEPPVCL
jgi:hypothetical protein